MTAPVRPLKRYDGGERGMLTAFEIADIAGCKASTVHARYKAGLRGEALLQPRISHRKHSNTSYREDLPSAGYGTGVAVVAARIAIRYRGQAPSTEALRRDFGMHRSTAARWRRAWLDALGEP